METEKKHALIIYHSGCLDGIMSAALINYYIVDPSIEKQFLGLSYDDGFDPKLIDKNWDVYLVDFSVNLEIMWELNDRANKVYWYDHHATAMNRPIVEEHTHNIHTVTDIKRSAARLVWDDLYGGEAPMPVLYVEDRDLWKFRFPETRAFTEGLFSEGVTPTSPIFEALINSLDTMHGPEMDRLIMTGNVLLKSREERIERAIKRGYYGTLLGNKAYYVNATEDISEIGERIYLSHPEPIIAVIYHYFGSDMVRLSLRSNSVDVEDVARRMGGGGHVCAAGATFKDNRKNFHEQLKDNVEPGW